MSIVLTLPQLDPDKLARKAQLDKLRKAYAYTLTYGGFIATVNQLPKWEKPGLYYAFKALINIAGLIPSFPGVLWKAIKHGLMGTPLNDINESLLQNVWY